MNILKPPLIAIACTSALLSAPTLGEQVAPKQSQLECKIGPLTKVHGGATWLVYSCDDAEALSSFPHPAVPQRPSTSVIFPKRADTICREREPATGRQRIWLTRNSQHSRRKTLLY